MHAAYARAGKDSPVLVAMLTRSALKTVSFLERTISDIFIAIINAFSIYLKLSQKPFANIIYFGSANISVVPNFKVLYCKRKAKPVTSKSLINLDKRERKKNG